MAVDYSRYARQIALPELGAEGQAALGEVKVDLSGLPPEAEMFYLRAGGVVGEGGLVVRSGGRWPSGACAEVGAGAFGAVEAARRVLGEAPSELPEALKTRLSPSIRRASLGSILDAVGDTPLMRLRSLERDAPGVQIYAKLEFMNPGGSVKDRAAKQIFTDAIASGGLQHDRTLIDSTSGNTGVAYSLVGAALGYKVALVMPSNVSQARKDITRAFGTELIFSDPLEGSDGAIRQVRSIVAESPGRYYYPDQYSNPSNPMAHYLGTGVEILRDLGDRITHFVAGLGTTGTMMGTTRRLKEHYRPIRCVAVEPSEPMHGLEGLKHIASSIVPPIYHPEVLDETRFIRTEDGWDMSDRLCLEEGVHVGHSSGANAFAALGIAKELCAQGRGGCVVTLFCDRGDRYFAPMKWEKRYLW